MGEQVVEFGRPDAAGDAPAPKLTRSWTRSIPSSLDPHSRFPCAHHRETEPFVGPKARQVVGPPKLKTARIRRRGHHTQMRGQ